MIKLTSIVRSILREGQYDDEVQPRAQEVLGEGVINALQSNYKVASELYATEKMRLYRGYGVLGTHKSAIFYHIDPRQTKRTSKETSNFYTALISDILPSWKKFPKRDSAVIASTSVGEASDYGSTIFVVFPKNDAILARCSRPDCWSSFRYAAKRITGDDASGIPTQMETMDMVFSELARLIPIPDIEGNVWEWMGKSPKKFLEVLDDYKDRIEMGLDAVTRIIKKTMTISYKIERAKAFIQDLKKNFTDSIDYFDTLYHPELNHIEWVNMPDFEPVSKAHPQEVWTDSDCILVNKKIFMNENGEINDPVEAVRNYLNYQKELERGER